MPEFVFKFTEERFPHHDYDAKRLVQEAQAVVSKKLLRFDPWAPGVVPVGEAKFIFDDKISKDEETAVLTVVHHHLPADRYLPNVRVKKCAMIDARTSELIARGFVFRGKTFSLSQNAQRNIMAMDQAKGDSNLTYPVRYATINDSDYIDLADAEDIHEFFLVSLAAVRSLLESGIALKVLVQAAATIEEIMGVEDAR